MMHAPTNVLKAQISEKNEMDNHIILSLHYLSILMVYGLQKQSFSSAIRDRFRLKEEAAMADIVLMAVIHCLREG